MKEVAPGVLVESSYAPYNLVLIETEKGGIAVDLPPSPMYAMNWLEQARKAVGHVRYAVLTSATRERQFATAVCDVPIIAAEATLRVMEAYDEERPRREFLEDITVHYEEEVAVFDDLRPQKPALAFNERFTFYAGDRVLQFEVVAGAALGSLWVLVEDQNLLVAGDTVVAGAVPVMAETPDSKAWLNTMTSLARWQTVSSIIPGRGEQSIPSGEIEPQREFMRVMRRAARTLARRRADGLSLSQTAQELGQTFFNRHGQAAVKQIRASLEHLVAEVQAADGAGEGTTEED